MPTCNGNNNINICVRFSLVRWWRSGKIVRYWPEGNRFKSGWATIDLFPQCFSSSYKSSMLTFKSSSQVSHEGFLSCANRGVAHPGLRPLPRGLQVINLDLLLDLVRFQFQTSEKDARSLLITCNHEVCHVKVLGNLSKMDVKKLIEICSQSVSIKVPCFSDFQDTKGKIASFREQSLSIGETGAEGNELGYETIAFAVTGVWI